MDTRVIPLRRPPVLVRIEGRFVPQGVSLEAVDAAWATLCARNPRSFDGPILQVLGVSRNGHGGVQIHVQESSYRFTAVSALGVDCNARPIGVKGIVGSGGAALIGRRSRAVVHYPGEWEFVPGGTLEPGEAPDAAIARELAEEARLTPSSPPLAVAVVFDAVASSWEIVYRIHAEVTDLPEVGWEHDEFRLVTRDEFAAIVDVSACARRIAPIAFARP